MTVADDLPPIHEVPAAHLEGRDLGNGWSVEARVVRDAGATGGCFSIAYVVVDEDGRRAFLKALNFGAATYGSGTLVDRLHEFTSAYIFERDLLADCRDRRMSRVIRLLAHGQIIVEEAGPILAEVPYLIFELAAGDIRTFQASLTRFDCAWTFRVMKHVLQGLEQLHESFAAHQDLKPSNVLTQNQGQIMKIGDLGRADRRGVKGPFSSLVIPGAVTYAPPEQHYNSFARTWEERKAADLYLAGSLGVQLFLGHCLSALMLDSLPPEFRPRTWKGTFNEVLPYLRHSHNAVLRSLLPVVCERSGQQEMADSFVEAIGQLTDPDPALRGHPKDRKLSTDPYGVRRFVSLMELLSSKAHYYRAVGRANG